MRSDSFRRLAAAAGLASATAAAGAQTIAPEVTVPLGGSYNDANCPPYGYGDGGYASGTTAAGVVYGPHGGVHEAYTGPGMFPARYPVERIPVQYLRYYPSTWYGLPGSTLPVVAPQVHMPTDTTQLGFYYQRVPTWVPVPGMIPGPPDPGQYHSYGPGVTGGLITDGSTVNGAVGGPVGNGVVGGVTNERIISERVVGAAPVSTTAPKAGAHTPNGTTTTPPNVVPVPPGGSALPLQPPTAPPAEPAVFVPPSAPAPLMPVSADDSI